MSPLGKRNNFTTHEQNMKTQMTRTNRGLSNRRLNRGGTRIVVFLLGAFVLGLIGGGYVHYRYGASRTIQATPAEPQSLSESTLAVLQRLEAPVELRLYAPSSSGGLSEATAAFAGRVHQLVSEYERAGGEKIRLTVSDPATSTLAKGAAGADGLLPIADSNGDVFYLGITIAQAGRKETIPQLSVDWESALESDLSRAITRVSASASTPISPAVKASAAPSAVDPVSNEELLRTIPDLETRSFESAAQVLREASLAEFTAAVREMQDKVQEAQKQLAAAQESKSEADQKAAMKQLQQVQNDGTRKLGEITAQLQARIAVLERLKGVNPTRVKRP